MVKRQKTIMVSTECYDELYRLKVELEKIFGSPASFTKLIRFLVLAKIDWCEFLALQNEDESAS
jgi:predicted CopG family antitoxin